MAFRDGATSLLLSRSCSNNLKHPDVMSCSWSEGSSSGLSPWVRYVTKDGCLRKTLQASVTRLFSQNCSITQKLLFHCHEGLSKATRPGASLMRTWNTNASSLFALTISFQLSLDAVWTTTTDCNILAALLFLVHEISFLLFFRQRSTFFPLVERGELDTRIPDHRDMLK